MAAAAIGAGDCNDGRIASWLDELMSLHRVATSFPAFFRTELKPIVREVVLIQEGAAFAVTPAVDDIAVAYSAME